MLPDLREVLLRHKPRAAYLFGSALRRPGTPLSDLDIAVLPPAGLSDWLRYYNDLHGDMCALFGADNIDLVLVDRAPLSLQARVAIDGLQIIPRNGDADWEDRVLARFADLAGWRRQNWELTVRLMRRAPAGDVNMIEKARVERFVFLIRDAVRELRGLKLDEMGLEAYQGDKRTRALAEHYLRIAIEATLDLGRHVIVNTGLGMPGEYRDVGKILQEKGIVPGDLGNRLQGMAGMRNILVHLYWDIDHALLYRTIVEELETFERFIEHIFRYLEGLEGPAG